MTAPKLKPCPFCGCKARLITHKTGEDSEEAYILCTYCNTQGEHFEDAYAPVYHAIAAWNTRTPTLADALALPEVKALVEAASRLSHTVDSSFYPEDRGGYETLEQMREIHAKEREGAVQTYVGARDAEEALAMSHRSSRSVIRGAKARINAMLTNLHTALIAINNKV